MGLSPNRTKPGHLREKRLFAEDAALLFGRHRLLPRPAGRLFGYLLLCGPPHPTAGELADALGMSAGSVSASVRLLEGIGLIERRTPLGQRSARLRARPDGWPRRVEEETLKHVTTLEALAGRGLALLAGGSPEAREPLEEMLGVRRFYGAGLQELSDRRRDHFTGAHASAPGAAHILRHQPPHNEPATFPPFQRRYSET